MWGVFFEDINFGADGGLCAELVKNGSFEFPDPMMGWFRICPSLAKGELSIRDDGSFNTTNAHYLRLRSQEIAPFGVSNEGFRGMGLRAGDAYDFSAQIRRADGSPKVTVELVGSDGTTLASAQLEGMSSSWKSIRATLRPCDTDPKSRLNVILEGKGTVDLDMVSLFPQKTWKNRTRGLRADMVQMLADLKPGFLRFPGGCIVEGSDLSKRYQWKNTIGPIESRKFLINRWNYEFKHRPTPDYFQSFGLGFFEYFQLAEDIGAEPLPIINCGMACQFNSGELVPLNELETYIQDANDLIEFANGPASSEWGAKRAEMGHSKPFNMKMLGVGNEQWGPQYIERYLAFASALKTKHPEITLVSDAGPSPHDDRFDFLWPKLEELKAEIVDQHCYANPAWFFSNTNRFDDYDRNGPRVFFGEYAAQSAAIVSTKNRNNLECALSEAAFMTGMERNADVVRLASYAPLFAHVDAWQWTPNLIWTDNLRIHGTPNYYVQQLFSTNRGDVVLSTELKAGRESSASARGRIGLATSQTSAEFKAIRVTRNGKTLFADTFEKDAKGWTSTEGNWIVKNGTYQQLDSKGSASAYVGDHLWTDYIVTLKARKLGGSEGFVIAVRDEPLNTRVEWNLGGWGNTQHGIQELLGMQPRIVNRVPGFIETGRWYDVRIELKGTRIDCYLDGRHVQSAEVAAPRRGGIFASAVRDEMAREVILKIVNATPQSQTIAVRLDGVKRIKARAKALLLTGQSLDAINSLDNPSAIAPRVAAITIKSRDFKQKVPANAFLVLRIPVVH
jgi:alpha-L-arabinofuranosidase